MGAAVKCGTVYIPGRDSIELPPNNASGSSCPCGGNPHRGLCFIEDGGRLFVASANQPSHQEGRCNLERRELALPAVSLLRVEDVCFARRDGPATSPAVFLFPRVRTQRS